VRKTLNAFTIVENLTVFGVEIIQPKETPVAVIGEIIVTNDIVLEGPWLDYKVYMAHVKPRLFVILFRLEFI